MIATPARIATLGEWMNIAMAARVLEKSSRQVNNYVEQGLIRARRVGSRGWKQVCAEDVYRLRQELNV